ncbi:MAG TPA: hypothetical protein VN493_22740 [Thermoanaerobaculia bacterium]|nr:hypothetical protein [Thermoanaerobaculia bacterium]
MDNSSQTVNTQGAATTATTKKPVVLPAWLPVVPGDEGPEKMYLKPERIQLMLRLQSLPGWQVQPDAKAIDRVRQFPSSELAMTYAGFAEKLARRMKVPLSVHLADRVVLVTLRGPKLHGRPGPVTQRVLDLALQLG